MCKLFFVKCLLLAAILMSLPQIATAEEQRFVALKSSSNAKYVSPDEGGGEVLIRLDQDEVESWEMLLLIENDDGTVHFKTIDDYYIWMHNEDARATSTTAGAAETFTPIQLESGHWVFQAYDGVHYLGLSTNDAGDVVLKTRATNPDNLNTQFELIDLEVPSMESGHSFITIESAIADPASTDPDNPDHYYLSSISNGTLGALVTDPQVWETFRLFEQGDGTVRIQSRAGDYVRTPNGGGGSVELSPVQEGGEWLTFTVVSGIPALGPDEVMLRTYDGAHYLTIAEDGTLEATATGFEDNAVFKLNSLEGAPQIQDTRVTIEVANSGLNIAHLSSGIVADAENPLRVEGVFNWHEDELGGITLTLHDGQNLCAHGGGGDSVIATSDSWNCIHFEPIRGLPGLADDEFVLQTHNGHLVNLNNGQLEATATTLNSAVVLRATPFIEEAPIETRVAIRSVDRLFWEFSIKSPAPPYISAASGDLGYADSIGDDETFTMLTYANGDVHFKTADGSIITTQSDNVLGLNSSGRESANTIFKIEESDATMLPASLHIRFKDRTEAKC